MDLILKELGEKVGMMFQVRDDILDVVGSAGNLGKTPGKDAAAKKLTFPGLHGLERSREMLESLAAESRAMVDELPARRDVWLSLVDFLARRAH